MPAGRRVTILVAWKKSTESRSTSRYSPAKLRPLAFHAHTELEHPQKLRLFASRHDRGSLRARTVYTTLKNEPSLRRRTLAQLRPHPLSPKDLANSADTLCRPLPDSPVMITRMLG